MPIRWLANNRLISQSKLDKWYLRNWQILSSKAEAKISMTVPVSTKVTNVGGEDGSVQRWIYLEFVWFRISLSSLWYMYYIIKTGLVLSIAIYVYFLWNDNTHQRRDGFLCASHSSGGTAKSQRRGGKLRLYWNATLGHFCHSLTVGSNCDTPRNDCFCSDLWWLC